jgi:ABC-2 type transport system ATP-binding protein
VARVIEVVGLGRVFQRRSGLLRLTSAETVAVGDVSFEIAPGELFGLLGPNGAGKTTTIKMLVTLLLPTSGSARVAGFDVVASPHEVRKRVGYVFGGDRGLYERLTGLDNLRYFAELYGVDPRDQRARIGELLELVGLTGREREKVEAYSRGMRQRLHIARGLLHDPPVLFLDEPTIGIDPVGARELRTAITGLRSTGKTILLTTHYMREADELCDRVAVIRRGEIVAQGTPASLKSLTGGGDQVLEVTVANADAETIERVGGLRGVGAAWVEEKADGPVVMIRIEPGADVIADVVAALQDARIERVTTREATLEDAYVELVSRE